MRDLERAGEEEALESSSVHLAKCGRGLSKRTDVGQLGSSGLPSKAGSLHQCLIAHLAPIATPTVASSYPDHTAACCPPSVVMHLLSCSALRAGSPTVGTYCLGLSTVAS